MLKKVMFQAMFKSMNDKNKETISQQLENIELIDIPFTLPEPIMLCCKGTLNSPSNNN